MRKEDFVHQLVLIKMKEGCSCSEAIRKATEEADLVETEVPFEVSTSASTMKERQKVADDDWKRRNRAKWGGWGLAPDDEDSLLTS